MEMKLQEEKKSRKVEFILSTLLIGHTRTTRSYLLELKQKSMCHACQTKYSVKHIFIEYTDQAFKRETFHSAIVKELFKNNELNNVM